MHILLILADETTDVSQTEQLNLEHMRGQGYDGARNMSGKYRGVQARVKELHPRASEGFFPGGGESG